MLFSRVLSALNFTGFFFPFTGEANLNVDSPECLLPATIAHELAHVRGVAPEQTANFVAILACDTSGDPLYAYSGYLLGYIHLSNALYGASYEKWLEIAQQVCQTANEDILANNAYWQQFESFYKGDIFSSEFLSQKETFSQVIDTICVSFFQQILCRRKSIGGVCRKDGPFNGLRSHLGCQSSHPVNIRRHIAC